MTQNGVPKPSSLFPCDPPKNSRLRTEFRKADAFLAGRLIRRVKTASVLERPARARKASG